MIQQPLVQSSQLSELGRKRVLLVDAAFSVVPIYDALKRLGFDVAVCGGNPVDFLAKSGPKYFAVDYSNVSALRKVVEAFDPTFVVPGCTDVSYRSCSQLMPHEAVVGTDCLDATEEIGNKAQFRALALEIGIPSPRVLLSDEAIGSPAVIVKPVDGYSGRGISVLKMPTRTQLDSAVSLANSFSRAGECVIEEFKVGQLYSHSAFVVDGQVVVDFVVEEHCNVNPYVVDTSFVVADFPAPALEVLRSSVCALAKHLKLRDGLVHTQFIFDGQAVNFVEVTRRCPGDLYSKLIEYATGYPYAEAYASAFVGRPIPLSGPRARRRHIVRHTISCKSEARFGHLAFLEQVSLLHFSPLCVAGDLVKPSPFGRMGVVFFEVPSEPEAVRLTQALSRGQVYVLE